MVLMKSTINNQCLEGDEEDSGLSAEVVELSQFLGHLGDHVRAELGDDVKRDCESWLEEKKRSFSGGEYIDQLEKNLIYFSENWLMALTALTSFIMSDDDLTPELIDTYLEKEMQLARDSVHFHQQYLTEGCGGCAVHDGHSHYEGIKELKGAGAEEYIEELEFCNIYYNACSQLSMFYIRMFASNMDAFSSFRHFEKDMIASALEQSTMMQVNISLDNVEVILDAD